MLLQRLFRRIHVFDQKRNVILARIRRAGGFVVRFVDQMDLNARAI